MKKNVTDVEKKKGELAAMMIKTAWTDEEKKIVVELIRQLSDYWLNPPRRRIGENDNRPRTEEDQEIAE